MDADYLERKKAAERTFRRQCAKIGVGRDDVEKALAELTEAGIRNAVDRLIRDGRVEVGVVKGKVGLKLIEKPTAKGARKPKSHVGGNCGASGRMASVTPQGGRWLHETARR